VVWWRDRLALVVLAAAAIPVMMLHDWLLAGDPTFWLSVAVRYSETTTNAIRGPVAQLGWLANRYLHVLLPLTIVGAIGVARLVQLRCWRIVGPVVALGGGTAVFLMVLAVRHIYVPLRYTAPIDIAVIVAASAAPGWILDVVARTSRARAGARAGPPSRAFRDLPGAVAGAAVLGVLVAWPYGVLHRVDIQRITDNRDVARNLARVTPLIAAELDRIPGARDWSLTTSPLPGGLPILVVTGAVIPRVSLDLDVPLTRLAALAPERVVPDQGLPAVGQIVFHDRNVDKRFPPIEISEPTRYGAGEAVPLAVDRARKYWLIAFRPS
jgi:hypothetical protein